MALYENNNNNKTCNSVENPTNLKQKCCMWFTLKAGDTKAKIDPFVPWKRIEAFLHERI